MRRSRLSTQHRSRDIRTGVYVLFVLTAGAYVPSPLYSGYQEAFAAHDLLMTLTYATFALVSAPALLLFGAAADSVGPRPVLRVSIVVAAIGSLCFAVASGFGWLLLGRAAQGLALGAATGAATALIATPRQGAGSRDAKAARRTSVLASTAFVAGTAAGPVVGGALAEYAPAPYLLPFLLHLASLAVAWLLVHTIGSGGQRVGRWRPTRPEVPHALRPLFSAAALTGFLAWTAAGLFLSVIPVLLQRGDHNNLAVIGGVLGLVLVCSVFTQRLVPALGPANAQLTGLAAVFASLVVLALSGGGSLALTLVAAVVAGAGHGLAYGGAAAAVEGAVPAQRRGGVTGALYLAFYLGSGFPAIAIGLMTLSVSLTVATTVVTATSAALVPLVAVVVVRARRIHRAPVPAQRAESTQAKQLPGPTQPRSGQPSPEREMAAAP